MNPGGCGGQDAGGPSEGTKRKGKKKKKEKGKDFVQGREKPMICFQMFFSTGGWPHQMARDHRPLHIPYN